VRVYTYNAAGRLATRTDQNGDVTTYSYDDLHRLTGRSYARDGGSVSYPTTQGADSFTYDRAGRMLSADHVQGSDTFTLDFEYDAAGRLTEQDQDGFTLAHAYSPGAPGAGFVETTYSNARTVKHNFDGRGRVALITTTISSVTTTQATNEYDDDNRLLERAFGNGTTATWTYDNEDRIATLKHHCPTCGEGNEPADFIDLEYGRDAEGNPTYRKHHHATDTSERYEYDAADRLVEFERGTLNSGGSAITGTPAEAQRWTLDALGNWSDFEKDEDGSTVSDQSRTHRIDNALTAIGGTTLTYDPPGNLKDDGTYLYDYDCENRLTRVRLKSNSNVIGEYGYNALGWRVKKEVSNSGALNGTFRLLYNSAWQLLEIRSVSGGTTTVTKQFIHAGPGVSVASWLSGSVASPYIDDHVAMLTPSGGGWTVHYYHADGLFNTLAMSDTSATVAERAQFEPYGAASLTDSVGDPITVSAVANPFQRQGITRDWEISADANRWRSYSPTLGRWIQREPKSSIAWELVASAASSASSASTTPAFRPVRPCHITRTMELHERASKGDASTLARDLLLFQSANPLRWYDPSGLTCHSYPFPQLECTEPHVEEVFRGRYAVPCSCLEPTCLDVPPTGFAICDVYDRLLQRFCRWNTWRGWAPDPGHVGSCPDDELVEYGKWEYREDLINTVHRNCTLCSCAAP